MTYLLHRKGSPLALRIRGKWTGMLDETMVSWTSEMGRTPFAQGSGEIAKLGRNHNQYGMVSWMAGGGIKKGYVHGETDEIGYSALSGKADTFDVQATILNQLGFDHARFTYDFQGRPFRLTDVKGTVIKEIIA